MLSIKFDDLKFRTRFCCFLCFLVIVKKIRHYTNIKLYQKIGLIKKKITYYFSFPCFKLNFKLIGIFTKRFAIRNLKRLTVLKSESFYFYVVGLLYDFLSTYYTYEIFFSVVRTRKYVIKNQIKLYQRVGLRVR